MRFRVLTLLLALTALCTLLAISVNADRIPAGALSITMIPIGVVMAVLIAFWRKTHVPTKLILAVLFTIGWTYLMAYAEVVLAVFRALRSPDTGLAGPLFTTLVGLFAAPAIVLGMLLLRSWLWAWHDRFGPG